RGPEVGRPLMTPEVVVVEPGSAAEAGGVLDVTGYATGDIESLTAEVLLGARVVIEDTLSLEPSPNVWTAFHLILPVGEAAYDTRSLTTPDGPVVAAIPFNRCAHRADRRLYGGRRGRRRSRFRRRTARSPGRRGL